MKTLVILSPGFPAHEKDSTCLPSQQIFVRTLNKIYPELKVIVLALQYPLEKKEYHWFGNTVISFDSKRYGTLLRLLLWKKVYDELRKILLAHPDAGLLSFWCSETALIGNYFAKKNNIRHYCWILGQDARKRNYLVRWIRPLPENLIALSDFLGDEFHKNHKIRPSHVIRNGIDPARFILQPARKDIDVLGVGSLIPLKRYDIFVQTVLQLKRSHPEIKGVLCGKGTDEERLRRMTETLHLQQNITFMGEVPHEQTLEIMQRSRILLHPSSYEGYCTACLEALYAGCHVVSFTRAEKANIRHWHIVSTMEGLMQKCHTLLSTEIDHSSVLVHDMESSARQIVALFQGADNVS